MNHHIIRHDEEVDVRDAPFASPFLVNSGPLLVDDSTSTDRLFFTSPQPMVAATPSPTNNHQRAAPEMVSILATSTPEIETLMSSSFDFLDKPNSRNSLQRQTSATTVVEDIGFSPQPNNNNTMMMMMSQTKTPAPIEKRHVPRVSLSPPRAGIFPSSSNVSSNNNNGNIDSTSTLASENFEQRSPLDDITRSLCRVRLSPSPTASLGSHSSSSSSSSSQRSTPLRARGPSPTLRKPSLHRRVSFDMLPSPTEIGSLVVSPGRSASMSSIPSGVSPAKGRRHRRNTTVIVLSASSSHK